MSQISIVESNQPQIYQVSLLFIVGGWRGGTISMDLHFPPTNDQNGLNFEVQTCIIHA